MSVTLPTLDELIAANPRRERPSPPTMTLDEVGLDELVASASMPSLSTLYKRGRNTGLIDRVQSYPKH